MGYPWVILGLSLGYPWVISKPVERRIRPGGEWAINSIELFNLFHVISIELFQRMNLIKQQNLPGLDHRQVCI